MSSVVLIYLFHLCKSFNFLDVLKYKSNYHGFVNFDDFVNDIDKNHQDK